MRILFLVHSFNSLAQRLFVDLMECGHEVSVEFDINEATTTAALDAFVPDLVVAPFLKRAIPEGIWRRLPCLVVHPGIKGDRGPSALDWAIMEERSTWGVTVLQANAEMDAGDIWASVEFPLPVATKSAIYRREVADAASLALVSALKAYQTGSLRVQPLDYRHPDILGRQRPALGQADRQIHWDKDNTSTVLRKLRAADSSPGVRCGIVGHDFYLFGGHREDHLAGPPGTVVGQRDGAICIATRDGAVWITHLRAVAALRPEDLATGSSTLATSVSAGEVCIQGPQALRRPGRKAGLTPLKLPAAMWLGGRLAGVPDVPLPVGDVAPSSTYREIRYVERGQVGYLHFDFYNGAMSQAQCRRLLAAYQQACSRPTRVIVLMGGDAFWSNGIHLHVIEAAASPADESWANILAMDDLCQAIIETHSHLVIAALRGNAAAGGLFLALAADRVAARDGIVLNPHYATMGNLYGSEYWTYLLPRRLGSDRDAFQIARLRLPIGVRRAKLLGLVDDVLPAEAGPLATAIAELAEDWASGAIFQSLLNRKVELRAVDEATKPLAAYRQEELAQLRLNFYGFDPSYHVARYNFVHRVPVSRTPSHLALHRRTSSAEGAPAAQASAAPHHSDGKQAEHGSAFHAG